MPSPVPVFDGHNDIVLKIAAAGERRADLWLRGEGAGHLDLPRMLSSGFAGGFFAVYIPSPETTDFADYDAMMDNPPYDIPLPHLIGPAAAQPVAVEMLGHLLWMERASEGRFRWCRTAAEIRAAMAAGAVAGVLHFEGAEPPAEGNLILRLDMLIAKNQDLLLHEDIDNLIAEALAKGRKDHTETTICISPRSLEPA